ncbi:MAG: hypothetical protein JW881_17690 [Spirochaetales bacterium]|nr:hypothetical protein [Spirochaetales bacterium]
MLILTYGEIIESGTSVFTSVAYFDKGKLVLSFKGVIRVDNPGKQLLPFIIELAQKLRNKEIDSCELDFSELTYCNSNGFYSLMDIAETIYKNTQSPVTVKRLKNDDWQQQILPILLNLDEKRIAERTIVVDLD